MFRGINANKKTQNRINFINLSIRLLKQNKNGTNVEVDRPTKPIKCGACPCTMALMTVGFAWQCPIHKIYCASDQTCLDFKRINKNCAQKKTHQQLRIVNETDRLLRNTNRRFYTKLHRIM